MSNRTVTKLQKKLQNLFLSFSTMSNRMVTKLMNEIKNLYCCFSTMSNRMVTKPRHGPAPDLLAVASG